MFFLRRLFPLATLNPFRDCPDLIINFPNSVISYLWETMPPGCPSFNLITMIIIIIITIIIITTTTTTTTTNWGHIV